MSEFSSKDFGERIKNYRISKGLTQENLAKTISKSQSTVRRFESGELILDVKIELE